MITQCFSQRVTPQYQDDRSTSLFTFAAALPILGNEVAARERDINHSGVTLVDIKKSRLATALE